MAVPVFIAVGAKEATAGADATPAMPTHQADDILLLFVETANEAATLATANGFVEVADSPQGTGTAGGTAATGLAIFWKRAASGSESAPVVEGTALNHVLCCVASFRGCTTSGDPWDVTAGDAEASLTDAVAVPGDTTTVADCLIVAAATSRTDNNTGQFNGAWANTDLANVTGIVNYGTNVGNGGGIGVATGEKATAGAFGTTTTTMLNTSQQGRIMLALKPPAAGSGDATGSGSPTSTLSSSASGTASQKFNGSGTPTSTLSSSATGTAVQKFNASGTPTSTLSSTTDGTATRTLNDSTGSGTPTDTLSSSATGAATQTFNASGTPTDSLSSSATGAATQKFNGSGAPTSTLSSTADGAGTNTPDEGSTLPTFVAVGTAAVGTESASPAWPTHQANDIALLVATTAAYNPTLSDEQGFQEVLGGYSPRGNQAGASAVDTKVWWCRATSGSMAAPTLSAPGADHILARIYVFRDVTDSGVPYEGVEIGSTPSSTTAVSVPGSETSGTNRLVVAISGDSLDTASADQYSDWANADLANVTERGEAHTATGKGTGHGLATGEKATAGSFGATTATLASGQLQAHVVLALLPAGAETAGSTGSGSPTSTLSSTADGDATSESPVLITPGQNIQTIIDNNPSATVFQIQDGEHRLTYNITPRAGMTLRGQSTAAILMGSNELHADTDATVGSFTSDGNGRFWIGNQTQQGTVNTLGECLVGFPECHQPEDLWIDDVLQIPQSTLADVTGAGKWFFDYDANRIYLWGSPANKQVETSVRQKAIVASADNVTLKTFTVEKFATPFQSGAIEGDDDGGEGWLVDGLVIKDVHGQGIRLNQGWQLRNSLITRIGQLGIGGAGQFGPGKATNIVVDGCEISECGVSGINPGAAGGAMKFTNTDGLVFTNNWIHDVPGNGFWCDIDNEDPRVEGNIVEDVGYQGIFLEIGFGGRVTDNLVQRCGFGRSNASGFGAGILIAATCDVEVDLNTVIDCHNGIAAVQQNRGAGIRDGVTTTYVVRNLNAHHNNVTLKQTNGDPQRVGLWVSFTPAGAGNLFTQENNRFSGNTYDLTEAVSTAFAWDGNITFAAWQAAGNDIGGSQGHPSSTLSSSASGTATQAFIAQSTGAATSTLSSSATGAAVQKFSGSGTPASTLSGTTAGSATQQFNGSGTLISTLDSAVTARALQADHMGSGAATSTLDSSATGDAVRGQDFFTASGSPEHDLSSTVAGVATQTFSGSGTPTSTLTSVAVGTAEQEVFAGPFIVQSTPIQTTTIEREFAWPGSTSDPDTSLVAPGDVAFLFLATKNQVTAPAIPGVEDSTGDTSNFVQVTGTTGNGAGTAGAADAVRLGVRWCRATSHHMRSVIVPDPGEVLQGALVVVRGCRTDADPWDDVQVLVTDPASTTLTIPGATSSVDNCLVLQASTHAIDTADPASNDLANATLQTLTVIAERSSTGGPGGIGTVIVSGEKLVAGTIDDTTGTWDSSTRSASITLVLRPPAPPTGSTGSGSPTSTLSSTAVGVAESITNAGTAAITSTLSSSAAGVATRALDVTGSGAATSTLSSSATGEGDTTTVGQIDASGSPSSTLSSSATGVVFSRPIVTYPPVEPPPQSPGQGRRPRKPKRILLPEEEPQEQPRKRRRRPKPAPRPVPEAQPLPELPPPPPAFLPVTFDPMLWASLSAPPVRPQTPVVTKQDIAEEEAFLAQLLDLI